jgi:hypothetical protein
MELSPVEYQDWYDEIPAGAELGACTERLRETRSEPVPNSVEVCGTPYTVDQGSGVGRVVQDCQYEVYENWCGYVVDEWQVTDTTTQQGSNLNPAWPGLALQEDQREGNRIETYQITFVTEGDGKAYTYETNDPNEFLRFVPGSQWELQINGFGSIVGADPK